jgi:hypothetical protein
MNKYMIFFTIHICVINKINITYKNAIIILQTAILLYSFRAIIIIDIIYTFGAPL